MDNIKKIISPLFRGITEMELEQMNTAGYLRQKEYDHYSKLCMEQHETSDCCKKRNHLSYGHKS